MQGSDTIGKEERDMMEDVHAAIFDLAELIKTYQSRNRIHKLLVSTLFNRRQDEMGAVIDRAISSLQVSCTNCFETTLCFPLSKTNMEV